MADRAALGGGTKTPISEGMMQRVLTGVKYVLSSVSPTTWFGPSQPTSPAAPESVKGRAMDYPTGANTVTEPRNSEPVSFAQMRQLADGYDLLRLVIETRKDQVAKMKWTVREQETEAAATGTGAKKAPDPRLKAIRNFLAFPDRRNSWDQWLRMVLEDMLVIDAASIYPRTTRGGQLYALEVIAGETIKRVIDDAGRTPAPPDAAYQQVLHGVPAVDYSADELIYYVRNVRSWKLYGFGPVEQIIITVNIAIRRQLYQLAYYTEGNVPEALCEVPEGWTAQEIAEFQEWWDSIMLGNLGQRRRMKFVPAGANLHETKTAGLKDEMEEWLARVVCFAFSISPQPFIKQMNRATAETAQEAALQEGLEPILLWIKGLMDLIIGKYFGCPDLEFAWEDEKAVSATEQATVNDLYVRNGVKSVDEVRAELGMEPIGMGNAVYTASGPVLVKDILNPPKPEAAPGQGEAGNVKETQAGDKEGKDQAGGEAQGDGDGRGGKESNGKVAKLEKAARKAKINPIDRNRKVTRSARTQIEALFKKVFPKGLKEALTLGEEIAKADEDIEARAILAKLKLDGWAVITDDVETILAAVAADGAYQALLQIGMSEENLTSTIREKAVAYAKDRAASLISEVRDSTREMLRSDVAKAVEEGWSTNEFKAALKENYAFSDRRAETIARTEIATADVEGNMTAYRESGVVSGKEWITGSETDCEECALNEAKGVIPLDDEFPSGDEAPPGHPNCVCDILPVLAEEGENE